MSFQHPPKDAAILNELSKCYLIRPCLASVISKTLNAHRDDVVDSLMIMEKKGYVRLSFSPNKSTEYWFPDCLIVLLAEGRAAITDALNN